MSVINDYERSLRSLSQVVSSKNLPISRAVSDEFSFWKNKTELSPSAYPRLKAYWDSVNFGSNWTPSGTPWSAAFVSHLLKPYNLPGSGAHWEYVKGAMEGKGGWKAFSIPKNIGKIQVSVGDVVVGPRSGGYYRSHGDVIYKIENGKAYTIGGNLSDTVKRGETINLDTSNTILDSGRYKIILKKNPVYGEDLSTNKMLAYGGFAAAGLLGLFLAYSVAARKGLI